MKWDASAERKLAILALQQHPKLNVDIQTIIDDWPGDEKPTFRATSDRLRSFRKLNLGSEDTAAVISTPTARSRAITTQVTSSQKRKTITGSNTIDSALRSNSTAFQPRQENGRSKIQSNKRQKLAHGQNKVRDSDAEDESEMEASNKSDDPDDDVDGESEQESGHEPVSSSPSASQSIRSRSRSGQSASSPS